MKKTAMVILFAMLLCCSACTSNPDTGLDGTAAPDPALAAGETETGAETGEADEAEIGADTGEAETPNEILALRAEYLQFGIENRLDYVPFFTEGHAPTDSAEYLFFAFAVNLDNWGEDKGVMTREYVDRVIRTHFTVEEIKHGPMWKGWDYDGEKYTAVPQGIKEKPIYVLQKFATYTENGRTVFDITMDECRFKEGIPADEDMARIRASIASGDLSDLIVGQTESFRYYLDQTTGAVVFLSHSLVSEPTRSE